MWLLLAYLSAAALALGGAAVYASSRFALVQRLLRALVDRALSRLADDTPDFAVTHTDTGESSAGAPPPPPPAPATLRLLAAAVFFRLCGRRLAGVAGGWNVQVEMHAVGSPAPCQLMPKRCVLPSSTTCYRRARGGRQRAGLGAETH